MIERFEQTPPISEGFSLTEHEQLFSQVSDRRLRSLLFHPDTTLHRIELSSNSFGEFLFITASRSKGDTREMLTFWGLGYHDYRERWLSQEWFWYRSEPYSKERLYIAHSEAEAILNRRAKEISQYTDQPHQSRRGQLFEFLADLTDEDGAMGELEDFEDFEE